MKTLFLSLIFYSLVQAQGFTTLGILMEDQGGYSTYAQNYFDNLPTLPGEDTLNAIASFIDGRVSSGVWAKLDEAWLLANKTKADALIGMKGYKNLTEVNTTTFTVYSGILTVVATSAYLNTNFKPSTDGINFTLNNSSIGFWCNTEIALSYVDMGARDGSGNKVTELRSRQTSNVFQMAQSTNTTFTSDTSYTSVGLFVATRTSATNVIGYKNLIPTGNISQNANGLTGYVLFLGSLNNAGSPVATAQREYAFAFVGGTLTAGDIADLRSGLVTLLTFLGAI